MHDAQHMEHRRMYEYYHNLYPLLGTNNQVEKEKRKGGARRIFILQTYPCVCVCMCVCVFVCVCVC
jgi:hypothetical protein